MERLELKHLAPYLPYGLMINCDFKDGDVWACKLEGISVDEAFLEGADWSYKDNTDFKPILRPMSDLTEGNWCRESGYAGRYIDDVADGNEELQYLSYNLCLFLFKNHFDVFGLIPAGLAIDINTLNK